jgi:hypothetical protein
VLVRDRDSAALYELDRDGTQVDHRLWLAHLRTTASLGEPIARFDAPQLLRLRLLDAAALAGIAEATLDMSVAYAGMREQFGRAIGSFQAVKHHCANMAMAARCARDQASFAAVAIDEGRDDAALQVESALFVSGSAALENAAKNIQIHGGIGFSDEADPHLFLKRAQLLITLAGGMDAANCVANAKTGVEVAIYVTGAASARYDRRWLKCMAVLGTGRVREKLRSRCHQQSRARSNAGHRSGQTDAPQRIVDLALSRWAASIPDQQRGVVVRSHCMDRR